MDETEDFILCNEPGESLTPSWLKLVVSHPPCVMGLDIETIMRTNTKPLNPEGFGDVESEISKLQKWAEVVPFCL